MKTLLTLALFSATAHAATPADCWRLAHHGQPARACFTQLIQSSNAYERAEGAWGLEDWQGANDNFRDATAVASSPAMYKVRWGMLLHERFNNAEAVDLFREALQKDPSNAQAYLGLAIVEAEDYSGECIGRQSIGA
jgi:cellulose synthase operon protein C